MNLDTRTHLFGALAIIAAVILIGYVTSEVHVEEADLWSWK